MIMNYTFFNSNEFKYLKDNLDKHINLYRKSLADMDKDKVKFHLKVIIELSGEITDCINNYSVK